MSMKSPNGLYFLVAPLVEPPACNCEECRDMCQRPCWPTPEEAKKLVEVYPDRLMIDYWVADETNIDILCPASRGREGLRADFWPRGTCTFLENGHCILHDQGLKPFEGRYAYHENTIPNLHEGIAALWDNDEVQEWVAEVWPKIRRTR